MPASAVNKRKRLVNPWLLSLAVVTVIGVLALLVPSNSFITNPNLIGKADALSVAYLQASLKANPDNHEIRMLYAEHLAGVGRVDDADNALKEVDPQRIESPNTLIYLDLLLASLRQMKNPNQSDLAKALKQALQVGLDRPAGSFTIPQWQRLATLMLQGGMTTLAADIYLRLAVADADHQVDWLRDASKWFVASGKNSEAGQTQLKIARISGKSEDAELAMDYMLAANQSGKIIQLLPDFMAAFPDNRALLLKGLEASLAINEAAVAIDWGSRWLENNPDDIGIMEKQVQLELGAGHPELAHPWAKKIVQLKPNDIETRRSLAKISEWSGLHKEAYDQMQWLNKHAPSRGTLVKTTSLAYQLRDYKSAETLLHQAKETYGMTPKLMGDLVWVQEKLGQPEYSEKSRVTYLSKTPEDRHAWEGLAVLREYLGNLKESEDTWLEVEKRFGKSETTLINRARMLVSTDRALDALMIMRSYAHMYAPALTRFWKIYGDISWGLEYHKDAFFAYSWLWDSEEGGSLEAQRLMILARERGDIETTLRVSMKAWELYQDPNILLLALESAVLMSRWQDVERLVHYAEKRITVFRSSPRYWMVHARWSQYQNNFEAAERDFQSALKLSPGTIGARAGLVWIWIQTAQRKKLDHYLTEWRSDATRQEPMWRPYAAGYRFLGQNRLALEWFRKSAQSDPDDTLWMLEYADALADAGQASGAWRLRNHLFGKMWPKSQVSRAYAKNNGIDIFEAMVWLKKRLLGLPHAEAWADSFLHYENDPVVREFALRWYFGIVHIREATMWLMRQHAARMQVTGWQKMAYAMSRNDLDMIYKLISVASGVDHNSTLLANRQLAQNDRAWLLSMDTSLGTRQITPVKQTTMLRHARDIAAQSPNAVNFGWTFDNFGQLTLSSLQANGFYSRNNNTLSLNTSMTTLNVGGNFSHSGGTTREYQLRLTDNYRFRHGKLFAHLGSNSRNSGEFDFDNLVQWGGGIQWRLWQGGELAVGLAMNDTGLETSAFRLIGKRDRAKFAFVSDITNREYFATSLNLHRFQTRHGESLATGYTLEASFGHRLGLTNSLSEEQIQVRLMGQLSKNRLESNLDPFAQRLLPNAAIETIIPTTFSSLGIAFNLQKGILANNAAIGRTPNYMLETWLGWQWPSSSFAYSVVAGVGMPLLGRDQLSMRAYVANSTVGGLANEPLYGVALWYSMRYGR
ncbi:MAG: tetratricopeptide repeat protein [Mariprofundaceae bacterium]